MEPSVNTQGGLNFLSLRSMKTVIRRYWDMIPMHDTVVDQVNISVNINKSRWLFTDQNIWIFRYGDVNLTGVDGGGN